MSFFSLAGKQVIQAYFLEKKRLCLALIFASAVAGWISVYVPYFSISLTLRSIPLLLVGFIFGPIVGSLNGAFVDLISFPWGGLAPYSFVFLLQTMSIGLFGGMGRFLMEWSRKKLGMILAGVVVSASIFYSFIFPVEIPFLLSYVVLFGWLWFLIGERGNKLAEVLLIIFSFLIYFSSFGMGVLGSILANGGISPLLFFKARICKELVKLFIFFPACYMYLNNRYDVFK